MTDYIDHGTTLDGAATVVIRKDRWVASKPWHADVIWDDGTKWKGWQSFFRSKKSLIQNARAALDMAGMHDAGIIDHTGKVVG